MFFKKTRFQSSAKISTALYWPPLPKKNSLRADFFIAPRGFSIFLRIHPTFHDYAYKNFHFRKKFSGSALFFCNNRSALPPERNLFFCRSSSDVFFRFVFFCINLRMIFPLCGYFSENSAAFRIFQIPSAVKTKFLCLEPKRKFLNYALNGIYLLRIFSVFFKRLFKNFSPQKTEIFFFPKKPCFFFKTY